MEKPTDTKSYLAQLEGDRKEAFTKLYNTVKKTFPKTLKNSLFTVRWALLYQKQSIRQATIVHPNWHCRL